MRRRRKIRSKNIKTWEGSYRRPLVVGSLGAIPKQFGNRLKQIGITVGTAQVQKTVLLGTTRILRKVLEI